jgi:fatty-acyl-CoA synthase
MLLEMAADGFADRVAVGSADGGLTYGGLLTAARQGAGLLAEAGAERMAFVDVNSEAVPVLLFSAGLAGVPLVPLNYRLADDRLRAILERTAPAVAVVDPAVPERVGAVDGITWLTRAELPARLDEGEPAEAGFVDPDAIAVLLYTSGTTGEPKAAVLRHRHLTSYVVSTV